jgi:hypothetical protein
MICKTYPKGRKYMISKHKLYKIALVSTAMILMLVIIVGAKPYNYEPGTKLITDPTTQSVDLLKFPACGCDCGFPTSGNGVTSITDNTTQSMNFLNFPV